LPQTLSTALPADRITHSAVWAGRWCWTLSSIGHRLPRPLLTPRPLAVCTSATWSRPERTLSPRREHCRLGASIVASARGLRRVGSQRSGRDRVSDWHAQGVFDARDVSAICVTDRASTAGGTRKQRCRAEPAVGDLDRDGAGV